MRDALTAGLAAGGATIDDFRHPDGVQGGFQHEFLVHLRAGEDCVRCGGEIVKFVAAGRGTYVVRALPAAAARGAADDHLRAARPLSAVRRRRALRGGRSGRP